MTFATANVCTLNPQEFRSACVDVQGVLQSGRITVLEQLFSEASLDVVGIQEARIPDNHDRNGNQFRMICCGATDQGSLGVQLWLRLSSQFRTVMINPCSPRLLLAVLEKRRSRVITIVFHSPIEHNDEEAETAWLLLETEFDKVRSHFPDASVAVMVDANGRVGSVTSEYLGSAAAKAENKNGERLRCFCEHAQVYATNTFCDAEYTWTGSRGHTSRIDYLLLSRDLFQDHQDCRANREVDLSTATRDDHALLQVTSSLAETTVVVNAGPNRRS